MIKRIFISFLLVTAHLVNGQVELVVQKGHSADIVLLEFSHSGRYLASLAANNEVIIWEVQQEKSVGSFSVDPNANVKGMKFGLDERNVLVRVDSATLEFNQLTSELTDLNLPNDTNYRQKNSYFNESSGYDIDIYKGAIRKKKRGKRFRKYKISVNYLNAPFSAFDVSPTSDLLVGVAADKNTYVHSFSSGKKKKILGGHFSENNDVRFTKDGKFFAVAGKDRSITIWNSKTLELDTRLSTNVFRKKTALFSYDGNYIFIGDELGFIYRIDFNSSFPSIGIVRPNQYSVNKIKKAGESESDGYYVASSNNYIYHKTSLLTKGHKSKFEYRDMAILKAKKRVLQSTFDIYQDPFGEPTVLDISPDGKKILYTGESDNPNISLGFLETKKVQHFYNPGVWNQWSSAVFTSDSTFVAVQDSSSILYLWKIVGKKYYEKTDTLSYVVKSIAHLGQGKVWLNTEINGQYIYDLNTRNAQKVIDDNAENVFKTDRFIVVATMSHDLLFYNMVDGKVHHRFSGHSDVVTDVNIHPQGRLVVSSSNDGTVKLWSFESGGLVSTIIPFSNHEFVFVNNDNYYMITKGAMNEIGFKHEGQFFHPEQFDLKYNRPDLVLSGLGFTDSTLIQAYKKAYLKRLKKMDFTEDQIKNEFHLPEIEIKNDLNIPEVTTENFVSLNLQMKDEKYDLDRLNVWVNDVAIYGVSGINLRDNKSKTHEQQVKVPLGKGDNKIEVSVLNSSGAESYKKELSVNSSAGKKIPDLYIVSFGVSKHKDSDFDLTYADKDAKDICAKFESSPNFDKVYSKSLVNEEVTIENLAEVKPFLDKADINDVVIVFIAGHGVLDDNYDYYFASHDMDFDNPSERGIPYYKIEELLDGIKALKKLLFIDTCHSGELDKDDIQESTKDESEDGDLIFRRAGRTVELMENPLGLQSTNELMKSLFMDLRKGTGATVISSSGGAELSIEGSEFKNGLFTYCVIQGLTKNAADLNRDKHISVSELQIYVREEVSRISKGLQTPTSRTQNKELDYQLW